MKKCLVVVVSFLLAMVLFSASSCFGEEQAFSAAWISEAGIFRIFNLQVGNTGYGADFTVTNGSDGEIYFSLISIFAPSRTEVSSWDGESASILIQKAKLSENADVSFFLKLSYVQELSTNGNLVCKLTDWYENGEPVFGVSFNAMDGFGDWKKNLVETSKFSNIAMISSEGEFIEDVAMADSDKIDAAIALGMKPLIVLCGILFYAEFDEKGSLANVSLYPDYRERLAEYASYLTEAQKKVWGVYLMDEYDWVAIQCGMSPGQMIAMVNEAILAVKAVLPTALTVGVAATTADDLKKDSVFGFPVSASWHSEYGIPKFDFIGFDPYWTQFSIYQAGTSMGDFFALWNRYMENLEKYILPGQKILLVPGTYENRGTPIPAEEHLAQLNFYREVVNSNPRVGAVVTFLWPSSEGVIGLHDLPSDVLTGWVNFGKELCGK